MNEFESVQKYKMGRSIPTQLISLGPLKPPTSELLTGRQVQYKSIKVNSVITVLVNCALLNGCLFQHKSIDDLLRFSSKRYKNDYQFNLETTILAITHSFITQDQKGVLIKSYSELIPWCALRIFKIGLEGIRVIFQWQLHDKVIFYFALMQCNDYDLFRSC